MIRNKFYFKPHTKNPVTKKKKNKNPVTGSRMRDLTLHKIISSNHGDQMHTVSPCVQAALQTDLR